MSRTGDAVMDELDKTARITGTGDELYIEWLKAAKKGMTLDKFIREKKRKKRKRPQH